MPTDPYEEPSRLRPTNKELPPIGVGIDYGTIMGRGAGGARFFGEGTVNLGRSGGSDSGTIPYSLSLVKRNNSNFIKVTPGTLNGILATNYHEVLMNGIPATTDGLVTLEAETDGTSVTDYEITFNQTVVPAAPTTPVAPADFKWPIGVLRGGTLYRLIGNSSLIARAVETHREVSEPENLADPGYKVYLNWVVVNRLL